MSRQIRFNGRETAVMRAIGFGLGISGKDLQERLQMGHDDMADVLSTLMELGYVETASARERVYQEDYEAEMFEINPSYVADLKIVLKRD